MYRTIAVLSTIATLALTGTADAHFLSGGRAIHTANVVVEQVYNRIDSATGWNVSGCTQDNAHQWTCDFDIEGDYPDGSGSYQCDSTVAISFAGRRSRALKYSFAPRPDCYDVPSPGR